MEQLTPNDTRQLAALHYQCLPDSLVSQLGRTYCNSFYHYVTRSPYEEVFVLRENGEVQSGCVLSMSPATLRRRLLLHTPLFFWAVPWLIRHALPKQGPAAEPPSDGRAGCPQHAAEDLPEVLILFTAPAFRNRGAGATLMAQCDKHLATRAIREYVVRTEDVPANLALKFYLKLGFLPTGHSFDHGRTFRILKKTLP